MCRTVWNYTPFTFFGALGTLHLTDRINLYGGTINGFDRWIDESYKWGFLGFATWKSRDEKTNVTLIGASAPDQLPRFAPANAQYVPTATTPPSAALAGQVNPYYASSYREFLSLVVTHQWTDKLTEVAETDHVWDPKIIGFSFNGKPSPIAYHGLVHWFLYSFNDKLSGGWRAEVFWDPYGAATGSRSTFYETSLVLDRKAQTLALDQGRSPLRLVAVHTPVQRWNAFQSTDAHDRDDCLVLIMCPRCDLNTHDESVKQYPKEPG